MRPEPRAHAPTATLALVAMLALVACSGPATAGGTEVAETAASRTHRASGDAGDGAAPAAPEARRDGDITDVDQLAASLAATATGDQDWVEVFSELRNRMVT